MTDKEIRTEEEGRYDTRPAVNIHDDITLLRKLREELDEQKLEAMEMRGVSIANKMNPRSSVFHKVVERVITQRTIDEPSDWITGSDDARSLFAAKLLGAEEEKFSILYLDQRHGILGYEELFQGTIDSTSIHFRVLVKRCMEMNAAACVIAHNHPSGNPKPSNADVEITSTIVNLLNMVDVRVLDHIVVGNGRTESMRESGYM